MNLRSMKRVLTCTLFLTVTSCTSTADHWKLRRIDSSNDIVCAHLSLPPKNTFRNLEVFFQKDGPETKVFLNTYSIPFQNDENGMADIAIYIDDSPTNFKAPILAGNQRILLPPDATHLLLVALNEKKVIVIASGKYFAEVHSEDFDQVFNKFNSPQRDTLW